MISSDTYYLLFNNRRKKKNFLQTNSNGLEYYQFFFFFSITRHRREISLLMPIINNDESLVRAHTHVYKRQGTYWPGTLLVLHRRYRQISTSKFPILVQFSRDQPAPPTLASGIPIRVRCRVSPRHKGNFNCHNNICAGHLHLYRAAAS